MKVGAGHGIVNRLKLILLISVAFTVSFNLSAQPNDTENLKPRAQWLQVGYTSNALGYGVNRALNKVFWQGRVHIKQGFSINYQRNIFYYKKFFAIDWGINVSAWQTSGRNPDFDSSLPEEWFFTFSVFPVFRINFVNTQNLETYLFYTVGGPSCISKTTLDGYDVGKHFIFLDNMGLATFFGTKKQYNVELRIGHYSNADLFPPNYGVKVPLTLLLGYRF
ncbi:MAG TPA: acyloxyacyl hydrolase [Paludibacter sp.]|jgi:hypothetical protein|nr:acyloxyacyl hydrolase [Paludibacter sp.]HOS45321.1 acyloxyacyl hydrolase [Paludibacter sp.]HPM10761.1 acyloxyacyl hydrolase [Paludibacter sp.]